MRVVLKRTDRAPWWWYTRVMPVIYPCYARVMPVLYQVVVEVVVVVTEVVVVMSGA